jgi:predicted O-methyltransferase YrrM
MLQARSSIDSPDVKRTLARLHRSARHDIRLYLTEGPRYALSRLTGRDFTSRSARALRGAFAAVPPSQGKLLYMLALMASAQQIVEFGCSYGVSTIYLAAAARDNGGRVITSELDPEKAERAQAHFRSAGLSDVITLLLGDARATLRTIDGPVDMLFLDGMKHLYLPLLQLLTDKLHPGSLVVADNTELPAARPLVEHLRNPDNGFVSASLNRGRLEVAYRL